jgi:Anti-sigma factor NepR
MSANSPTALANVSAEIRARLGENLRAHYDSAKNAPVPDRLVDLVVRLARQIEQRESEEE